MPLLFLLSSNHLCKDIPLSSSSIINKDSAAETTTLRIEEPCILTYILENPDRIIGILPHGLQQHGVKEEAGARSSP